MKMLFPLTCFVFVSSILQGPLCAGEPTVWMMPSSRALPEGSSIRALFEHPEQWTETREAIDVLFYAGHALNRQFTDEELAQWLPMLNKWNLRFGLEVGAVKEWGITGAEVFRKERPMWDRFQKLGVTIYGIAMDEPLWAVRHHFKKNKKIKINQPDDAYAVQETAAFVELVRKNYPRILIGDIEPYPAVSVKDLLAFIDDLQAELTKRKVKGLDFFRLDVNWDHPEFKTNGGWQEVKKIEEACRERKIPFSLIYWAADLPGLQKRGLAEESTWYTSILRQGHEYAAVGGSPDEFVIESWIAAPPRSVPETADWTFTRSVRDFCRQFVNAVK